MFGDFTYPSSFLCACKNNILFPSWSGSFCLQKESLQLWNELFPCQSFCISWAVRAAQLHELRHFVLCQCGAKECLAWLKYLTSQMCNSLAGQHCIWVACKASTAFRRGIGGFARQDFCKSSRSPCKAWLSDYFGARAWRHGGLHCRGAALENFVIDLRCFQFLYYAAERRR